MICKSRLTHRLTPPRFILTARAYIFEEARRASEHLADRRLDVSKCVLDVGKYTRRIRARILYNHLHASLTPQPFIAALVASGELKKTVDHRKHNPHVVAWTTDVDHLDDLDPLAYPAAFLAALGNPSALWDVPFRSHISKACQHLLYALFFCSQYGATIPTSGWRLKLCIPSSALPSEVPGTPKTEESLKVLEGGFIAISSQLASFVNPFFARLYDGISAEHLDPRRVRSGVTAHQLGGAC